MPDSSLSAAPTVAANEAVGVSGSHMFTVTGDGFAESMVQTNVGSLSVGVTQSHPGLTIQIQKNLDILMVRVRSVAGSSVVVVRVAV